MVTISVAMIVQNEEGVIRRALSNVHDHVDEIVIVDGGSTDKTKKIVGEFSKVKLFEVPFEKNFAKQKNEALKRCTKDWIFLLDADETLERDLLQNLQRLVTLGYDSYAFARKTRIDGILYNIIDPDYQIRFWKNKIDIKYSGKIHESPVNMKSLEKCNMCLNHDKTYAMQERDNELYWSMGQTLPSDVRLIDGKYVRIKET